MLRVISCPNPGNAERILHQLGSGLCRCLQGSPVACGRLKQGFPKCQGGEGGGGFVVPALTVGILEFRSLRQRVPVSETPVCRGGSACQQASPQLACRGRALTSIPIGRSSSLSQASSGFSSDLCVLASTTSAIMVIVVRSLGFRLGFKEESKMRVRRFCLEEVQGSPEFSSL